MTTGAGSRRKGHSFEREIARLFRDIFPDAHRGIQSRAGDEEADVVIPHYWIECKRGKKTNIKAALRQAREACAGSGKSPVAICKDDQEGATATMDIELFYELMAIKKGWLNAK